MPSFPSSGRAPTNEISAWPGWIALCSAGVVLYGLTASRGVQWQDSGHQIWRAVTGELGHPLGLALVHPLHHWLGRLAVSLGVFEPCFAVTLISAVAAAVAVANTYGCVLTLTRHGTAALLAAASLGLAHTFWRLATVTEIYTLTAALLSAEWWCVAAYAMASATPSGPAEPQALACANERTPGHPGSPLLRAGSSPRLGAPHGYLFGALFLNGLGIANHMLAGLTTPVLAVILIVELRRHRLRMNEAMVAVGLWLVGSLPYTGLVLATLLDTGDVVGTLKSALFGSSFADRVLNVAPSLRGVLVSGAFTLLSFPNFLLPAWVYGMVKARRAGVPALVRRALLAGLALHALFVLRYNVVDQHFFFLPLYVLMCLFGGVGFAHAFRSAGATARRVMVAAAGITLALTPAVHAAAPAVASHFEVLRGVARNKPYRDDYVYLFTPWSFVERSAERMSRHAVDLAGPNGVIIVEDPMAEYAVRYLAWRVDPNTEVTSADEAGAERIRQAAETNQRVVLVPARTGALRISPPMGEWQRTGDLYVLERSP